MTSHMPLSTVHIEIDIDSNADELFSYFTNWSSFRAVGFPFAKFVNLPDGKMVTGQELDLVARYFIFFTQTVYSNIIKIDPATRVWESYPAYILAEPFRRYPQLRRDCASSSPSKRRMTPL